MTSGVLENILDYFKFKKNPYQKALDRIFKQNKEYNRLLRIKNSAWAGTTISKEKVLDAEEKIAKYTDDDIETFILARTIQEHPELFDQEVPARLAHRFNDKLDDINQRTGVFEHMKTFEEYDLYDTYLENSNQVKDILSHFKIKYEIYDENPILKIVFPYSANMYGGRWIDNEYKLIESFMKELLRYDFKFKVDETEETTTLLIDC